MYILGISCFYHDSSACIIKDGKTLYASQEERFTRIKHDPSFPKNSIKDALKTLNLEHDRIDKIIFYEKPLIKFERILETAIAFSPGGFKQFSISMPLWIKEKFFQKKILANELVKIGFNSNIKEKILFSEHHLSHAASAFYASPFAEAVILVMDGVGEWTTSSVYVGSRNKISKVKEIKFPHSLGLLYSAFTYYCGFKVNSGEYKLMGLAPYGRPVFKKLIYENLIQVKDDGSFRLNLKFFDFYVGLKMTNSKFDKLFMSSKRNSEGPLNQVHMDIAASIQAVLEEILLKITSSLQKEFKLPNLCLAGGVALNCVANSAVEQKSGFKSVWIQPAAGDAGCSLGAALAHYYLNLNFERKNFGFDQMCGTYLGPEFSRDEIVEQLNMLKAKYQEYPYRILNEIIAQELQKGSAVGWFQGRMEFGPRALGNRSILASPLLDGMQKRLNLKVKFRESFRPFAPAIIYEEVQDWFEYTKESPYMLKTAKVKSRLHIDISESAKDLNGMDLLNFKRTEISAVTHIDYSSRVQTVHRETNPIFYDLVVEFKKRTGCPILVNTSFNVRGEPIVCTPEDAWTCFMGTDLDILVIGNFILYKTHQDRKITNEYYKKFDLD